MAPHEMDPMKSKELIDSNSTMGLNLQSNMGVIHFDEGIILLSIKVLEEYNVPSPNSKEVNISKVR
jgi:hypothetical protein